MSLNRIMLIGNAGTDPEMRYTPNGNAVTSFRLAVTRRFGGGDEGASEPREETEWFTVVCWNRQAESVNQYLTKGKKVYVEGRFRSRDYTAADGTQRKAIEVADARVLFLDRAGAPAEPEAAESPSPAPQTGAASSQPRRKATAAPRAAANGDDVEELPW